MTRLGTGRDWAAGRGQQGRGGGGGVNYMYEEGGT